MMPDSADFLPTTPLATLKLRSEMLHWLRCFFRAHGYWETPTQVLSHDVCVDAWLEPFPVPLPDDADARNRHMYLQTSPEFALKRLVAAWAETIFQIGPAFRQGESGPLHNPEFLMVEWYRVGASYRDQMDFTESLVRGFVERARALVSAAGDACRESSGNLPVFPARESFHRLTYDAAFSLACGRSVLTASMSDLRAIAAEHCVTAPASLSEDDWDGWLNLLLAEVVEPALASHSGVFLHDYPASQAALSRIRDGDPPVAERFELYLQGVEICNGYQELTDADELKARLARQSELRTAAGLQALLQESRLLSAMEAGLPDCSGVALGFDRLLMVALGAQSLREVIPFPFDRA